jgi:hypothetical protein
LIVYAASATVDSTLVRNTLLREADQQGGEGILVEDDGTTRSSLSMSSSIVDTNQALGLGVAGSDATVQTTLVRNTVPASGMGPGIAVMMRNDVPSSLSLSTSMLDHNAAAGLVVFGGAATVEHTVIRDSRSVVAEQYFGYGILAQNNGTFLPTLAVSSSTIASNYTTGIFQTHGDATLKGLLIRDTMLEAKEQLFGDAVLVKNAKVSIGSCVFENNQRASVTNMGSDVTIERVEAICSPIWFDVERTAGDSVLPDPNQLVSGNYTQHDTTCVDCNGVSHLCTAVSGKLVAPAPIDALNVPDSQ